MIFTRHEEPDQSHYYIAAERDFNGATIMCMGQTASEARSKVYRTKIQVQSNMINDQKEYMTISSLCREISQKLDGPYSAFCDYNGQTDHAFVWVTDRDENHKDGFSAHKEFYLCFSGSGRTEKDIIECSKELELILKK